jgi:hypothetical protein
MLADPNLKNYYYSKFNTITTSLLNVSWYNTTVDNNYSTGYFGASFDLRPYLVSSFTNTALKYISAGSLVKFEAPIINGIQQCFDKNNGNALTPLLTPARANTSTYIWAEVVSVIGDGTANGTGVLLTGEGPVSINATIPSGATATKVIPVWRTTIENSVLTTMIDLITSNTPFGLRYDVDAQAWKIIFQSNLNSTALFNLNKQGDSTNTQLDASWLLLFTTDSVTYTITARKLRYIFESDAQLRFYFDPTERVYDNVSGQLLTDSVNVLSVNTLPGSTQSFTFDQTWKITNRYIGSDGYIDTKKIIVTFSDKDGVITDPETFDNVAVPADINAGLSTRYVIFEKYSINQGQEDYRYVTNSDSKVVILPTKPTTFSNYVDGQYFYFVDSDSVAKLNASTSTAVPSLDYKVFNGRSNLKFQYTHNASEQNRIDPGVSNIMDVFVLTDNYDTLFRQWLNGVITTKPLPPSTDELNNTIAPKLNLIKSISDEIIYHPVKYKVLFGSKADAQLQAQFKVITNSSLVLSDNDVKTQILAAINKFFSLNNWDFGDTFYFTEMASYITQQLSPNIVNFVIVPTGSALTFGGLFEITAGPDEIFISGATIDNIDIVSAITPSIINSMGSVTTTSKVISTQTLTSSAYGITNV